MTKADPAIVEAWARGWALTRGVAPPAAIAGGFHIEVGLARQESRYVLTDAAPACIQSVVSRIQRPWVHVKICDTADAVEPLLPERWIIDERVWMMVGSISASEAIRMPEAYSLGMEIDGHVLSAEIFHRSGVVAARGKAALVGDRLVFDQIVTEEAHRRRGLGRSIMAALTQTAGAEVARAGVLVATDEGAALYSTLGWSHHTPVTSAVIPAEGRPPSR